MSSRELPVSWKNGPNICVRSWAVSDWPQADRLAWEAIAELDEVDQVMAGQEHKIWRQDTWNNVRYAFELAMASLNRADPSLLIPPLCKRFTPPCIEIIIDDLSSGNSPRSVADYVERLKIGLARLDPKTDIRWIRDRAQALRTPKARPMPLPVAQEQLRNQARLVMASAIHSIQNAPHDRRRSGFLRRRAENYRDGLIMLFLAYVPIRLGNVAMMRHPQHLSSTNGMYMLAFADLEMKNKSEYSIYFPDELNTSFDYYFAHIRHLIAGAGNHDFVWPSNRSRGLPGISIHQIVTRTTERATGHRLTTHRFRNVAADQILESGIGNVQHALGHKAAATSEQHYTSGWLNSGRAQLKNITNS